MEEVFEVLNLNLANASCCKLEVVNGSLLSTVLTLFLIEVICAFSNKELITALASASFLISLEPFALFWNEIFTECLFISTSQLISQYSSGTNLLISLSLSLTIFNVADCTLPALFEWILRLINADNLKPIIRSSILLVSWLDTRFKSMVLGFCIAAEIESRVIS